MTSEYPQDGGSVSCCCDYRMTADMRCLLRLVRNSLSPVWLITQGYVTWDQVVQEIKISSSLQPMTQYYSWFN